MEKSYILILKSNTSPNGTQYTVAKVSGKSYQFLRQGNSKNGMYQIAHRVARQANLPLYEEVYRQFPDENGILHLIPVNKREIPLTNKENTTTA